MSAVTAHPPGVREALVIAQLAALDASLRRWRTRRRQAWVCPGEPPLERVPPRILLDHAVRQIALIETGAGG